MMEGTDWRNWPSGINSNWLRQFWPDWIQEMVYLLILSPYVSMKTWVQNNKLEVHLNINNIYYRENFVLDPLETGQLNSFKFVKSHPIFIVWKQFTHRNALCPWGNHLRSSYNWINIASSTVQKIIFSIWSHLLKKSLMNNSIFGAINF